MSSPFSATDPLLDVLLDDLEGAGIRVADAPLGVAERVLQDVDLDAVVGKRASLVEPEGLQVARDVLQCRDPARLHRGDELDARVERGLPGGPQAEPAGIREARNSGGAGRGHVGDARIGELVLEARTRAALLRRRDLAPVALRPRRVRLVEDDDAREAVAVALVERAGALIARSGLVVAHNARFDRPFVERVLPAARTRPWACTRAEVGWTAEGFASQALHCLLCAYGVFARDRHRALADSEAGVWLLAQRLPVAGETVLAAMRRRALTPTVRLWAIRAPFETKETLRARGYRWMPEMRDGIERAWWTDVEPDEEEAEFAWLRETIYGGMWHLLPPGGIPRRRVRAFERWREDPADLAERVPVYPAASAPVAV